MEIESAIPARRRWGREALFIATVLSIFGLDQLTKFLVRSYMTVGESVPDGSPIRLTYIKNTGGAFGLFPNQTLFLVIVGALGVAIILYFYRKQSLSSPLLRLSLALQLGGAFGNLLDRIRLGHVTDFVDLRVWPIFNLADTSIVIGVFMLIFYLTLRKDKDKEIPPKDRPSPS